MDHLEIAGASSATMGMMMIKHYDFREWHCVCLLFVTSNKAAAAVIALILLLPRSEECFYCFFVGPFLRRASEQASERTSDDGGISSG